MTIPGPTVIGPGQTIISTQNAPPPEIVTSPPQTVTVQAPPATITVAPPPPVCVETGLIPVSDSAGCDGRNCQIEFQEGAAVHWVNMSSAPPLRTALTFINSASRQTCITTSCNTELFDRVYKTSLSACARPPCPSNTVNCDCSIVVGPIVLPGGSTTSVTQVGPSGWNVNLFSTATANDIGLCSAGGPQCVTATARNLAAPIVYRGEVSSTALTNNGTGAVSTRYLLPGLGDYFPPGDPFGACTTVELNSIDGGYAQRLRARQVAGPNSKDVTWPGAPDLIASASPQFAMAAADNIGTTSAETTAEVVTTSSASAGSSPTSPAPQQTTTQQPSGEESASSETPPNNQGATSVSTQPEVITESPSSASPTSTAVPPPNNSPPSGEISSSTQTGVTVTGTPVSALSGTIYVTNTVYYSMVYAPDQQSILNAVSMIETGARTVPSQDFGAYITSLLGLNQTSGTAGTTTSSGSASPATATGKATGQAQIPRALAAIFCLVTVVFAMQ